MTLDEKALIAKKVGDWMGHSVYIECDILDMIVSDDRIMCISSSDSCFALNHQFSPQ